jgi:hypothetical protein
MQQGCMQPLSSTGADLQAAIMLVRASCLRVFAGVNAMDSLSRVGRTPPTEGPKGWISILEPGRSCACLWVCHKTVPQVHT